MTIRWESPPRSISIFWSASTANWMRISTWINSVIWRDSIPRPEASRCICSLCGEQTVTIHAADLQIAFEDGETIWTENSHKYSHEEIARLAEVAGFHCEAQWIDHEWPFAESLFVVSNV